MKSSTILHKSTLTKAKDAVKTKPVDVPVVALSEVDAEERHPYLVALGQRMGALRARQGMTRKAVALAAGVSERHLANMEYGVGNASVLVLLQVSGALHCAVSELIGDITTSSPEWLMIREMLSDQDDASLQRVRIALGGLLGNTLAGDGSVSKRIALIGLRGAGKSTLGAMLAKDLGYPFVELSREIEKLAGGSVAEIQALYGVNAARSGRLGQNPRRSRDSDPWRPGVRGGNVYPTALAMHERVATSQPGGPPQARHSPRRHAPDGRQQRGYGRLEGHPGRARRLLLQGATAYRHQRASPGAHLCSATARGAAEVAVARLTAVFSLFLIANLATAP
jgi:transcriptional regulator with XRE-family HTH domain